MEFTRVQERIAVLLIAGCAYILGRIAMGIFAKEYKAAAYTVWGAIVLAILAAVLLASLGS